MELSGKLLIAHRAFRLYDAGCALWDGYDAIDQVLDAKDILLENGAILAKAIRPSPIEIMLEKAHRKRF